MVNVAGPHSSKINEMAGLAGTMRITTRALRHEVAHVPAPKGFDVERQGTVFSDSEIGSYSRPETGNHMLIGSEDPACDEKEWVDPDDYLTEFTGMWTTLVMRQAQRFPGVEIPEPHAGRGRPLRRHRGLGSDLRQVGPEGLLSGDRHQRQPVQERADRRRDHGRDHRGLRERPRPRQGPGASSTSGTSTSRSTPASSRATARSTRTAPSRCWGDPPHLMLPPSGQAGGHFANRGAAARQG